MARQRWFRAALLPLLLGILLIPAAPLAARPATQATPTTVTIPGTIQSVLGCPGDWQPTCANTYLSYNADFDLWSARFALPAGDYEYKVAIDDSWNENYGLGALRNGPNIPLSLAAPADVLFVYDHKTNWVADSVNQPVLVVTGDFQPFLGCAAAADPTCLGSWMSDADGDGLFTWVTTKLPAGTYQALIAQGETLDNAIGADGAPNGAPIALTVANDGDEIYVGYDVNSGNVSLSTTGAPRGNLARARAYWVAADTIVWDVIGSPRYTYELHSASAGGLQVTAEGIAGGTSLPLSFTSAGPGAALERFPHLAGFSALKLDAAALAQVPELLRGQIAVLARDENRKVVDATGLQIPGVLDDIYAYDGPLGVSWQNDVPTLRLWAPTARNVALLRFETGDPVGEPFERLPMSRDDASGVWSIDGETDWNGQYYLYEVEVYVPSENAVVTNRVTDPYSFSLSANSTRSQIVDLSDPALAPADWADTAKPPLEAPEDIVLYELHVRDFSIFDQSVPEELRGTFAAFTLDDSTGVTHLRELAEAGVTHVHLLPAFDIATIEEIAANRVPLPLDELAALPPDSPEQQEFLAPIRDRDGFNWGYDPFHFTVPEGSYSTDPNGSARIREFRAMVQSLNAMDLRVVMDVVYNHTNAAGQAEKSVFDKIVPGYYHRLDGEGNVTNSTCCSNTATEHRMMEKLMVDSLVTWAKDYKVDGFRFDLMGHHMKSNMLAVREALDALTLENDGVDGKGIYVYGEGWDFGEVGNNARGENATQINMAGTGIGTFSDRLRDGVRGGGPFDGLQEQGFATGLFTDPSEVESRSLDEQRSRLLSDTDLIKLGLAGNLKDYRLINAEGREVRGEQVRYRGAPAGYTLDPQEQIVYVSAHDNETLFDAIQIKAPLAASVQERARMAMMGLSLTILSQGVPFIHAGDELLRSKSLDRNSYNSSDWFNRIDWTGQENTFGAGLPPSGDNEAAWPVMQPLLANPALKPDAATMGATYAHVREMLTIRRSTPLFRLRSAEQIQQMVRFFNNGPDQTAGLIVMSISDNGTTRIDPNIGQVVVLFNSTPQELSFADVAFENAALNLHDVQVSSQDERVIGARFDATSGSFSVPARTTAVFVGGEPIVAAPAQVEPTAVPQPTAAPAPTEASEPTVIAQVVPTAEPAPSAQPATTGGMNPAVWFAVIAGIVAVIAVIWYGRRRK